jgi:hypothetical protein
MHGSKPKKHDNEKRKRRENGKDKRKDAALGVGQSLLLQTRIWLGHGVVSFVEKAVVSMGFILSHFLPIAIVFCDSSGRYALLRSRFSCRLQILLPSAICNLPSSLGTLRTPENSLK